MQDSAVDFVTGYRDTLFGGAPAVLLTSREIVNRVPNSTGLVQRRNLTATLGLIRQLQPDVRQVFVVSGAARSDGEYEDELRRQFPQSDAQLAVTYLSGLATAELERRLSQLPEHSAVYHLPDSADGAGSTFRPLEDVDRVAAAANAPTYSWVDSTLGHGIVGGSLTARRP